MKAVYHKGQYRDLGVDWENESGTNADLTGYTIVLVVAVFGKTASFTKSAGFTILTGNPVPSPNLTVQWDQTPNAELDSLAPGNYILAFEATQVGHQTLRLYGELELRENAPNFGYCEASDLQLGSLNVPATTNPYDYINTAADEMNAELGQLYQLPLTLSAAPGWVALKLKNINADLAAGMLIAAQAVAKEDQQLHAYAEYLLKKAYGELGGICDGQSLVGLTREPTSIRSNAPEAKNHDATSGVDAFEEFAMRRNVGFPTTRWRPGTPA